MKLRLFNMEISRKKFKIWTNFFHFGRIFLLMQQGNAAWLVLGGSVW